MTLPEWVEAVSKLIGKLSALPVKISTKAMEVAAYLGISFAAAVAELWRSGLAKPLSELSESKLQKIKSTDIAEAAEAHNKALLVRREAEAKEAEAERIRAEARKIDADAERTRAEARAIDGNFELKHLEMSRQFAKDRRRDAEARLGEATKKLRAKGGELFIDPPKEQDKSDGPGDQ